ncbi:MAG: hypothetical protein FWC65_05455 [Treponema sp.]|nr:hypothetical protein [Treponema sp.]
MTKRIKIGIFALLFSLAVSSFAFSQNHSLGDLTRAADNFATTLARSLPLNSALGLNWSDAYIGQFFPSVTPSFGVGFTVGITTMNRPAIEDLAVLLGFDGMGINIERFPFPAYAGEARIGGFFGLPFDVGLKVGVLPPVGGSDFSFDYTLIGGDIRYAILDRPFLPTVSLGVGFNYLRGGVGGSGGGDGGSFTFRTSNGLGGYWDHTVDLGGSPNIDLHWRTFSLDVKAQISHSFAIATPFFGVGWSLAWSRAGYEVGAPNMVLTPDAGAGGAFTEDDIRAHLRSQGIDPRGGISSHEDERAFNVRLFGGVGFNMAFFVLDLGAMMCLRDANYGASIGFRFQM